MRVARVRRSFFEQEPLEVGQSLIGMELGSELSRSGCGGLIVETEVYVGPEDRASHAWNARRTARTEVLFGPRGYSYVFQIYGAHYCFNIVVGAGRVPAAVLIRALRPTFGLEIMAHNRGLSSVPANLRQLTSGPGRLAQALGIDRQANGLDLCQCAAVGSALSGWTPSGRCPWNPSRGPDQRRLCRGMGKAKLAIFPLGRSICQRLTAIGPGS